MDARSDTVADGVIRAWVKIFESQKSLADGAIAQLSDPELHAMIAPGTNSVAVVMNHVAGNMLSRWTDWLTTDGEKPGRSRDHEFQHLYEPRAAVVGRWDEGWSLTLGAVRGLCAGDLSRVVTIRGEPHSVLDAVNRQISHYGYHVGQIMLIARVIKGNENWRWLTVAPGGSDSFNAMMKQRHGERDSDPSVASITG